MDVLIASDLAEALEMKMRHPGAVPVAGGTDVMVEVNFGRLRPHAFIDICRIPELREHGPEDRSFFLGAGVTYSRIVRELGRFTPLATAARTIGSPQIRNRATIGGNLGSASPAGDALPVLSAFEAEIVVRSTTNEERAIRMSNFLIGPRRNALRHDELIVGCRWKPFRGPGVFSKVGSRNAMAIAAANLCLVLDEDTRRVCVTLGSVGPGILRAPEAESLAAEAMTASGAWDDPAVLLAPSDIKRFAELVAQAARPIDDVRGTAAYRRRACEVMAKRALAWALEERAVRRAS